MKKSQAPITKSQTNTNVQNPNFQKKGFRMFWSFGIGVWDLPGVWNLGFGILPAL
jgi:hypothetical protein